MSLFVALALLLTFGCLETTVLESGIKPTDIPCASPTICDTPGHKVIAKVIPEEAISKLATIKSLLDSKVQAAKTKINQPLVIPAIPMTPVTVNVPDCLIAIPLAFKDGMKYVAVKTKNFLQQTKAQNEANLAKIKANLLAAVKNMKKKQVTVGRILLKPVVIVGATKGSIVGKKLKKVGSKLELIGDKLSGFGEFVQTKGDILHSKSKKTLLKTIPRVKVIPGVKKLSVSIPVVEFVSLDHPSTSLVSTGGLFVTQETSPNETVVDRSKRNTAEEHVHFGDLLKIVESLNLTHCVLRVICELNCDPEAFGKGGSTVYNSLVRFEVSGAAKGENSLIYRESALKGRNLRKPPKDCGKCSGFYPNCNANSTDLIKISSRIQFH